jgi:hypothetical protein
MNERLLQFIWQFQYFNSCDLRTEAGELLSVIHAGHHNSNQGPDFLDARIRVGDTILAGSVELHLQSSGWSRHRHQHDPNYNNVVLHVVWEDDVKQMGSIPVLVLQHRVSKLLLQQYSEWMQRPAFIACATLITTVKELVWVTWKERLLAERLQRKCAYVLQLLQRNNNHWEETFWQLLAKNFGMKVNAEAFENIARSLPLNILAKHKTQLVTIEALLMGQAGLLEQDFTEAYARLLRREYYFYKHKYHLVPPGNKVHFLRMRPAAFPTVRLAQLAMLLYNATHLFVNIKEARSLEAVTGWLNVTANDYWHYHYRLDEPAAFKKKNIGASMIDNILINTIIPMLFAYGHYHNEQPFKDKALQWLEMIAAEKNSITANWQQLGIAVEDAWCSQALTELKTQYCDKKRCLDCAAGNALLSRESETRGRESKPL